MEIITKEITDKIAWEEFVLRSGPQSFLQSWNWGETNRLSGSRIVRYGFFKADKLLGVSLYILQKAKRGPHILVPGGPIIDWNNRELVNTFISCSKKLAKENGCWFVRVRPELLDTEENKRFFSDIGFTPANMHLHAEHTWVLDINEDADVILGKMRKTTRYLVKKSLSGDITVEITDDVKKVDYLVHLQKETVKRHKFIGFSRKLFENQLNTFGKDNQAKIVTVFYKGKPLASAIIIFYGDTAYYHHSGSSEKAREIPVSYRLQWEVINYAKKQGFEKYNFWGIAPEASPKHRFYGVTVFKTGFGGARLDWLHAHDIITSPLYYATYLFEYLRKTFRRL